MKIVKSNNAVPYKLLLILVIIILYSTSMNYPMYETGDDYYYILGNGHLKFSLSNIVYWFHHTCLGNYLPLTMISYMPDYAFWEYNSLGYHLQNMFWHIITALVIFNCFKFFRIKSWIAFFFCLITSCWIISFYRFIQIFLVRKEDSFSGR